MAFRTLIISTHSKIEYSLDYLVFRTVDEIKRVHLDEISTVIFESTNISITSSILIEMVKRKINIIFCDEKHNPLAQLNSLYGSHNTSKRLQEQIKWDNVLKDIIWKEIIKQKIKNQKYVLKKYGRDKNNWELLENFESNVVNGDFTNREGHAAKVYFNSLFYEGFSRNNNDDINMILNYGYSIILSLFNRTIISFGYLTQIGIHHKNEYNQFNFSCDLMEPFRPLIDIIACKCFISNTYNKEKVQEILNLDISINNTNQSLTNSINIYVSSIINALNNGDIGSIKFPKYYDL